jgi:hypothetical protein
VQTLTTCSFRTCLRCSSAPRTLGNRVHRHHILDRAQYQIPPTAGFGNAVAPTSTAQISCKAHRTRATVAQMPSAPLNGAKRKFGA